jgi:hypothetical protein
MAVLFRMLDYGVERDAMLTDLPKLVARTQCSIGCFDPDRAYTLVGSYDGGPGYYAVRAGGRHLSETDKASEALSATRS